MKASQPDILAWLADSLGISPLEAPSFVVISRRDDPSSTHWVVDKRSGDQTERLFIKMHASPTLFSQERSALSVLSEYSSSEESFAVPRMRAFSVDLNCIALDWIEGASVGGLIRSSVSRFASSETVERGVVIAYKVGTWLQKLKERTIAPPSALPCDAMFARFKELMQFIETAFPRLLSRESRLSLIQTFERDLASAKPEADCLVHNDFWFDHIWTRGSQIVVIDFGRAHIGPAGRDAIQFYCRLVDMSALNPLVSKRAGDEVKESFVRGYGGLDLRASINRVWQLWTRAEQLAGLVDFVRADYSVRYGIRMRALAHRLRRAAE